MQGEPIPANLNKTTERLASVLHWPHNLGIEFRQLHLQTQPATNLLLVFVGGMADASKIRSHILEPLENLALIRPQMGRLTPVRIKDLLPAPQIQLVTELEQAIAAGLGGASALCVDGSAQALVVETVGMVVRPTGDLAVENPRKDLFGPVLMENVAMLRQRIRDPMFIAEPEVLSGGHDAQAALLYLHGRADPQVLAKARAWVQSQVSEESVRRGKIGGARKNHFFLPQWMTASWPDKAAVLLDAGYIVLMVDRISNSFIAPVTTAGLVYSPSDYTQSRFVRGELVLFRLILAAFLLLGPGMVVALLNYHQEMLPTPFLLGLVASRQGQPLPIAATVLLLELFQELLRELTGRLPGTITPGQALLVGKVIVMTMIFTRFIGPLPGLVSMTGYIAGFALPSVDFAYLVRIWRFIVILAASVFGLCGMAAVLFLMATYASQATSFGLPVWGESGMEFAAPGRVSSRGKGGGPLAKGRDIR